MSNPKNERPAVRVMIVEDERLVAQDLAGGLEDIGYAVIANVGSGEEAIICARDLRPDIVLMDVHLAGALDGVQAALAINQELQSPVIFLTAHAGMQTLQDACLAAPFAYLIKPYNINQIRCSIEAKLYKHRVDARMREQLSLSGLDRP